MLVTAPKGWVSSSPPQFLFPHRKELKQQTRIAQAGKVYWASSKKYILETWEQSNPHWSGLISFWLLFFNLLFPPLGGLQSLIGYALYKWSMNPRPIREGNENRTYVWDQSVKGSVFLLHVFTLVHSLPFSWAFFFFFNIFLPSMSEKAMAPHSSTLAWKVLWMEEPGQL